MAESPVWAVEAETSWAAAEDCSATEATSETSPEARSRLGGDLLDGGGDVGDARGHLLDGGADLLEGAAGLGDGGDAVLGVAVALGDGFDDAAGLDLDLAVTMSVIWAAAARDSSARPRTSSATTANPRRPRRRGRPRSPR